MDPDSFQCWEVTGPVAKWAQTEKEKVPAEHQETVVLCVSVIEFGPYLQLTPPVPGNDEFSMVTFTKSIIMILPNFKKIYLPYGFINLVNFCLYYILVYYSSYLDDKYMFLTNI